MLDPTTMETDEGDQQLKGHVRAVHAMGTLKHRKNKKKKKKISTFERRYTALGPMLRPERKRIDYVLVYKNKSSEDAVEPDEKESLKKREDMRERFEKELRAEGFSLKEELIEDYVYIKLHCPFKRLCQEAEKVKLEMPLKGVSSDFLYDFCLVILSAKYHWMTTWNILPVCLSPWRSCRFRTFFLNVFLFSSVT